MLHIEQMIDEKSKYTITILTPTLSLVGGVETWIRSLITKSDLFNWNVVLQRPNSNLHPITAETITSAGGKIFGPHPTPDATDSPEHITRFENADLAARHVSDDTDLLVVWGDYKSCVPLMGLFGRAKVAFIQGACAITHDTISRIILGGVDDAVAISESSANLFPDIGIKVINLGVDFDRIKVNKSADVIKHDLWGNRQQNTKYVGFVGRLAWLKHPTAAAQAVSLLPPHYKCVMVGDGHQEAEVLNEAKRLCGNRLIHIRGCDNVADHMAAMDVLIFASPAEGCGLVLMEALATGTPVIGTRVGIVDELENKYGKLIWSLPDDPTAMEIANEVREVVKIGRNNARSNLARKVICDNYSDIIITKQWEEYFADVIKKRQKPNPKVSILVPLWNEEKRVKKALRAIINQSFKDFEIIIIDDKSTDNTVKVVKDFIKNYDNIKLICRETNGGTGAALNEGFIHVKGKYSTWWSGDSWPDYQWIEHLTDALDKNEDAVLAYGDWLCVNDESKIVRVLDDAHVDMICKHNIGPCWLFKTKVKDVVGEYINMPCEDRDMHIRMSNVGKFIRVNKVLGTWKSHENNVTNRKVKTNNYTQSVIIRAHHALKRMIRK